MPNPLEGAESAVSHKAGGVPVWVWVVVAVGGGLAVYFVFFRASGAAPVALGGNLGGSGGGGTTGGGSSTTSPVVAVTPLSNAEWYTKAVIAVSKNLGMDPARVALYLREYLNGRMPVGSSQAISDFSRVVQAAIEAVGQPHSPPSPADPNTNPFLANSDWLANALGFLPKGLSGSARQEIIALFNGTLVGTQISQEAADAIDAMRNVLGYEPRIANFTIKPVLPVDMPIVHPLPPDTPVLPGPILPPPSPVPVIPPVAPVPSVVPIPAPIVIPPIVPAPPVGGVPAPPIAPIVDRGRGWGKQINDAYAEVFGRAATDQEIWDWAGRMQAGTVTNIRQAIIDLSILNSPRPTENITSGWGKTINDLFNVELFRNATNAEIYAIANRMQSGELSTIDKIRAAVLTFRRRIAA